MLAHAVAPTLTAPDASAAAREQFEHLITHLRAPEAHQMTHRDVEALLEVEGRELLRRLLHAHLDARGPGTVAEPVIGADGHAHPHQRLHTRRLMTIFGEVAIERTGSGGRGTPRLHPLDAALNVPPEHDSHGVRQRVAVEAAHTSFDAVVASITTPTGAHVPTRQAEHLVVRAAQDCAALYATQRGGTSTAAQDTRSVLVISVDGTGVPMRQADLRHGTRQAAAAQQPTRRHRRQRGERASSTRMATVATVYTIAPWVRTPEEIVHELQPTPLAASAHPRPERKRVWASLVQPPVAVIRQAFDEAARRAPQRTTPWVALVDGDPTPWCLLYEVAAAYGVELRVVLDLIHVVPSRWNAAHVFHPPGTPDAEVWVTTRLARLLRGRSQHVAAGMRRSATVRHLTEAQRAPVDQWAHYLLKYADFVHDDADLVAGFPIATGVIEGACRHLVKDRMALTGARWSLEGAEAVLRVRSVWVRGDCETSWRFHLEQEHRRHHTAHYAGGEVPVPQSPAGRKSKSPPLRLIT
jgi:hypothetical protein